MVTFQLGGAEFAPASSRVDLAKLVRAAEKFPGRVAVVTMTTEDHRWSGPLCDSEAHQLPLILRVAGKRETLHLVFVQETTTASVVSFQAVVIPWWFPHAEDFKNVALRRNVELSGGK